MRFSGFFLAFVVFALRISANILYFSIVDDSLNVSNKINEIYAFPYDSASWILSIISIIIFFLFLLYIGCSSCRYGEASIGAIYASYLTPWTVLLLSAIIYIVGYCLPSDYFIYTANIADIILLGAITKMLPSLLVELVAQEKIDEFLQDGGTIEMAPIDEGMEGQVTSEEERLTGVAGV